MQLQFLFANFKIIEFLDLSKIFLIKALYNLIKNDNLYLKEERIKNPIQL